LKAKEIKERIFRIPSGTFATSALADYLHNVTDEAELFDFDNMASLVGYFSLLPLKSLLTLTYKFQCISGSILFKPKYLYYATIYGFINKPELEHAYYDSARVMLEKMIINFPEDPRLYSSLGITYAGLGFDKEAVSTNEKAVKMLPVSKEAWIHYGRR
jgi:tetratricopeptide (TPR) repeat protein